MENKTFNLAQYYSNSCCIFKKTKEQFGGLSNMASGFPLSINNHYILTSEALYQACRFPHLPELQEKIISEKSPMAAKMISKPFRKNSRPDWDEVRVDIMRWCLHIKLAQNYIKFGELLSSTKNLPIVEDSSKDNFWGAIRDSRNDTLLVGSNVLGLLLAEIREFYYDNLNSNRVITINPLQICDFNMCGEKINSIEYNPIKEIDKYHENTLKNNNGGTQGSFDF